MIRWFDDSVVLRSASLRSSKISYKWHIHCGAGEVLRLDFTDDCALVDALCFSGSFSRIISVLFGLWFFMTFYTCLGYLGMHGDQLENQRIHLAWLDAKVSVMIRRAKQILMQAILEVHRNATRIPWTNFLMKEHIYRKACEEFQRVGVAKAMCEEGLFLGSAQLGVQH